MHTPVTLQQGFRDTLHCVTCVAEEVVRVQYEQAASVSQEHQQAVSRLNGQLQQAEKQLKEAGKTGSHHAMCHILSILSS